MLRLASIFAGNSSESSVSRLTQKPILFAYPQMWQPVLFSKRFSTIENKDGYYAVLQKWSAPKGNTLLHERINHCYSSDGAIDFSVVDKLIDEIGSDAAAAMSIVVNDDGKLPVHLLADLPFDASKRDKFTKLYDKMYALMKLYPVKSLKSSVDVPLVNDDEMNNHLRVIVDAVNQTRSEISYSNTHPSYNDIADDFKKVIDGGIREIRASGHQMTISKMAEVTREFAFGNCHEYCYVLMDKLMQKLPAVSVEMVRVCKGDHVVVVVGRDRKSDIENPQTWVQQAIVCDAWVGDVYMSSELNKRLHTASLITMGSGQDMRVLKSYNPRFHCLQPYHPRHCEESQVTRQSRPL